MPAGLSGVCGLLSLCLETEDDSLCPRLLQLVSDKVASDLRQIGYCLNVPAVKACGVSITVVVPIPPRNKACDVIAAVLRDSLP